MPTYEYACKGCNEHLEIVQAFTDDPLTECPTCGGALRKVFSAAGIIFKGSGWHIKDYASSSSGGGSSTGASNDSTTSSESNAPPTESSSGDTGTPSASSAPAGV